MVFSADERGFGFVVVSLEGTEDGETAGLLVLSQWLHPSKDNSPGLNLKLRGGRGRGFAEAPGRGILFVLAGDCQAQPPDW